MRTLRFLCGHCGAILVCPETDAGQRVLCEGCFKSVPVPKLPEADPLEMEGAERIRQDDQDRGFKSAAIGSPSLMTPPAPPVHAKDPDKALTGVALGIFRLNNWPCHDEPGYKAFTARVKFHSAQLDITSVDDFRVHAEHGLLVLESPVLDLPSLPGVPLLETLNEINQRAVASTFVREGDSIRMRHAVIPRERDDGYLTGAMILQVLRQMNHDRRHALSLLRTVVETRLLDPLEVVRAFATPLAPCALRAHTLAQTADLAVFAGYHVHLLGNHLALSRDDVTPDKCPVRVVVAPGLMRGWVNLGELGKLDRARQTMPVLLRGLCDKLSFIAGWPSRLLEHLNDMNRNSRLVRLTYARKYVVATSCLFPTDHVPTVEQFRAFADALLECAREKKASGAHGAVKLAG